MISKVYVSTSNASLIQLAQTVAISSLGFLWSMGPVNEMRTVKVIPSSKWAWMVLDNGSIYTTNTGPNPYNRTVITATSLSSITEAFAPTPPLSSPPPPPPFVLSFIALINGTITSTLTATAPVTAAFTGTHTYNGGGTVSGIWNLGDGTAVTPYTSSAIVNHTYNTGSWTASLALTESTYNSTSVAVVYVSASIPSVTPLFYVVTSSGIAPVTAAFANSSSANVGSGISYGYRWVFGDGTDDSVYQPTHVYSASNYPVRLEITESGYGMAAAYVLPGGITGSTPVLISGFVTQSVGFGGIPESYMDPVTMSFTASGVTYTGHGGLEYNWNFGNGESSASNAGPIGDVMYSVGGYTASLSITESSYGITSYFEQSFTVSS